MLRQQSAVNPRKYLVFRTDPEQVYVEEPCGPVDMGSAKLKAARAGVYVYAERP